MPAERHGAVGIARLALLTLATVGPLLAAGGATARTLKIATVLPEGSSWMREMRAAGGEIAKETRDRVKLKFYPGGIMGDDKTVLRKLRAGQLHGAAFTSGALAQVVPDTELYSLPFLFRNYAEVDYVRERLDPAIRSGLEAAGFAVLAISDGGFAYLLSRKPLRKVDDLVGTKVWIIEGDIMSETALEVAGVTPVPLPLADVYTGLQTGLVDTIAAPPQGAIAFQWHTKVKYLTDVPLMYLVGVLAVDRRVFDKLSDQDQKTVRNIIGAAARRLDSENRRGDVAAKQALANQGIEFVTASSDAELERWRDIAVEAVDLLRKQDRYSDQMIDDIQATLETFRSENENADGNGP